MSTSEGIDRAMKLLRSRFTGEMLEHRAIIECLTEWSNPRWKLTRLVKTGALIRLRPGLFVFGPAFRLQPLFMPSLANLIIGPSYVSLEWALAYHGLIPEAAVAITSVTFKKRRLYTTPVGRFIYEHIPRAAYAVGITWVEQQQGMSALIATPEKALTDELVIRKGKVTSVTEMEKILFEDLRMDEETLFSLDLRMLHQIHAAHPHSAVKFLIRFLERGQR